MDRACYWVLMDIWRSMQYLVWKSAPETRSRMESMDGDKEVLDLEKEKEDFQRKLLELEREEDEADMVD